MKHFFNVKVSSHAPLFHSNTFGIAILVICGLIQTFQVCIVIYLNCRYFCQDGLLVVTNSEFVHACSLTLVRCRSWQHPDSVSNISSISKQSTASSGYQVNI
jgi:hypothetical protein